MFVQEEKIFAGKILKIHICTMEGTEWLEEVTEDTTIEKLKEKCLKHYVHGSLEDPKTLTHHKLVHAATERILMETKTVSDENLKDKDVLLLIKKRPPPPPPKMADISAEEKKQDNKAPDKEAILKATAGLSTRHTDRTVTQHNIRDFQTELRKILVSLIEVAQKLLALNPDAVELFKKANAMLDEDDEDRVDETALQQLTEMGFPESRAIKALRLNHMSVTQAMEWLIEHVDDPTVDTPLPGQDTPGAVGATAPPLVHSISASAFRPSLLRTLSQTSTDDAVTGARQDELTEIFKRIRRKREFRPDSRAVIALMEMGFDEKEVVDALRVNNNQQDAACEWLLGDRKPSPEDLDKGIDTNSPLFQAILENPVVQLGLTNPKTLLAFEDMLENPLNSTQWMNDPETGPVMLQISRIFQTLNRT
ncbi:ubiquitin-associated domain-containing protein 1 isoform X4 [Oncorhynchus mykiss]|uniref:ubiquitin-associated domain-containing protein 1-like isoform X4 n=1 Tax=Oncorhynchus kisutch TaxID=8019 RepID=UPI0012DBE979|nr:ubiquitin-associated domain-containing protein 1-like isoform X4 [Oncorhynchus kisutch]XP_036792162.1 ubiquitin-associated domain-containing protein 1 isoform X4 [Oncorhynchus mykiss]